MRQKETQCEHSADTAILDQGWERMRTRTSFAGQEDVFGGRWLVVWALRDLLFKLPLDILDAAQACVAAGTAHDHRGFAAVLALAASTPRQ